jgi:hypothetical protein
LAANLKSPIIRGQKLAALKVRQASPKLNKECQPVNMILWADPG